jgi:hypothetical protein
MAGRMETSVEEFRAELPALLRELGLETPKGVIQSPRGKGGRPIKEQTSSIHAEWVRIGKPQRTSALLDRLAETFFADELRGVPRGSPQHRKVRERVRQTLQRGEKRAAT